MPRKAPTIETKLGLLGAMRKLSAERDGLLAALAAMVAPCPIFATRLLKRCGVTRAMTDGSRWEHLFAACFAVEELAGEGKSVSTDTIVRYVGMNSKKLPWGAVDAAFRATVPQQVVSATVPTICEMLRAIHTRFEQLKTAHTALLGALQAVSTPLARAA